MFARPLLLLLCAVCAWSQVEVTATCPWQDRDGYTPIVLTARSDVATVVDFVAEIGEGRAELRLAVPAGEPVRRTLLVPTSGKQWSASVTLNWRTPGQNPGQEFLSPRGYRDLDLVIIDPQETYGVKELRAELMKIVGKPPNADNYGGTVAYADNRCARWAADELPDRWQGYPSWITLVLTPTGERRLNDAQRAAISAWTSAGGALLVTEESQLAGWRTLGAQVQVLTVADAAERVQAVWKMVDQQASATPVPGTSSVPVYGFVSIALLFAVLVGPVNLWWCGRRGRRHLLLFTTPALSLVASLALLTYGLLADGLSVRRTVVQVLALDQVTGRVSGWTGMTLFAGLPPSTITLDDDALLVPLDPGDRRHNDAPAVALVWGDGEQLARGSWIPARVNRQLGSGVARGEKRRLVFTPDAGGWSVANGFEQSLTSLRWTDPAGTAWHLGQPLAPGEAAALVAGTVTVDLPPLHRLPVAATLALRAASPAASPQGTYNAIFAGPLLPIPGPAATDVVPVQTWVSGRVLSDARVPAASTGF